MAVGFLALPFKNISVEGSYDAPRPLSHRGDCSSSQDVWSRKKT